MNSKSKMPPCVILCGGMGTRLRDVTELLPKPMVPIGPQPIIWHIMKYYAAFGVTRFILCLGYKREVFVDYFMNYHQRMSDFTIKLDKPKNIIYHDYHHKEEDWEVTLVYTGLQTMTGGRIFRASKYINDADEDFFMTYGDAVSNVDISQLYDFHRKNNKEITVTAVNPAARFGVMRLSGETVTQFCEKPDNEQDLINGGFMIMKKSFINKYLKDDPTLIFERTPMAAAVADKEMAAFVHEGFWQCMDVQREYEMLNKLWDEKKAPWKVW